MQSHEKLTVWNKSVDVAVDIYAVTENFPAKETYGLSSQMRRAAVSISSNIAEGRRRATDADFRHFLTMAHGSLAELETQLTIASKLSFISNTNYSKLLRKTQEISKMLHGMIKKLS